MKAATLAYPPPQFVTLSKQLIQDIVKGKFSTNMQSCGGFFGRGAVSLLPHSPFPKLDALEGTLSHPNTWVDQTDRISKHTEQ